VLENVALPLRINGVAAGPARIDAIEMLEWVGAGDVIDRPASLLSRGERLLCSVARATAGRPELLVADEPFESLGDALATRLLQLIVEMNRLGTTIILATASETWCRRHPARTLTLEHGHLRERAVA
jgi:cell division transport system ATP-binding protein